MEPNVQQAVPFFGVTDMEASLRFYVEGVGFTMTNKWTPEGRVRWCWLQLGGAAIMLQEYLKGRVPEGKLGQGVNVCFQCKDAIEIWRGLKDRGIDARRPMVGNGFWVTGATDPDGYRIDFESPADAPEETEYTGD